MNFHSKIQLKKTAKIYLKNCGCIYLGTPWYCYRPYIPIRSYLRTANCKHCPFSSATPSPRFLRCSNEKNVILVAGNAWPSFNFIAFQIWVFWHNEVYANMHSFVVCTSFWKQGPGKKWRQIRSSMVWKMSVEFSVKMSLIRTDTFRHNIYKENTRTRNLYSSNFIERE